MVKRSFVLGTAVAFMVLALPLSAHGNSGCVLFDPDRQPPYEGPDAGAWNQEVPSSNGGYVTVNPTFNNSGQIKLAVVRSIWVWSDAAGTDSIEWALVRVEGSSTVSMKLTAWFNQATSSDSRSGGSTTNSTQTVGLYPRPNLAFPTTLTDWHGTLNGQDNVQPLTHNFRQGYVVVHAERYNTCDDPSTRFTNLHYRSGPIDQVGTYSPWPEVYELIVAFDDPEYECFKPYLGSPDTEFRVAEAATVPQQYIFCVPDPDPL